MATNVETKKTATSLNELRADLLEMCVKLRNDPKQINEARELVRLAGMVLVSCKLEIEYALARGEKPECQFISGPQPQKCIDVGSS